MHIVIYSYHPETFEYLGPVTAQASPLEPDVILMTEGTTTVAPPVTGTREAAIFRPASNDWIVLPDFRNTALYSTEDGRPVQVFEIGTTPSGMTETPRPSLDYVWNGDAWVIDVEAVKRRVELEKKATIQKHMDAAARALGYDDVKTAVTYADEPAVAKFQAEGQALRAWRSMVWEKCYEILADVEAGVREVPDDAELLRELPELPALG